MKNDNVGLKMSDLVWIRQLAENDLAANINGDKADNKLREEFLERLDEVFSRLNDIRYPEDGGYVKIDLSDLVLFPLGEKKYAKKPKGARPLMPKTILRLQIEDEAGESQGFEYFYTQRELNKYVKDVLGGGEGFDLSTQEIHTKDNGYDLASLMNQYGGHPDNG